MSDKISTELILLIDTAIDKWLSVNSPDEIAKSVNSKLDKYKEEITLKLLGFDRSYGDRNWRLDHCNGRSGNSTAGQYLVAKQSDVVKQWLEKVPLPELSPSQLNSISKDFNEMYLLALRESLTEIVKNKAKEDSQKLLNDLINTDSIDNYLKTKELIQS